MKKRVLRSFFAMLLCMTMLPAVMSPGLAAPSPDDGGATILYSRAAVGGTTVANSNTETGDRTMDGTGGAWRTNNSVGATTAINNHQNYLERTMYFARFFNSDTSAGLANNAKLYVEVPLEFTDGTNTFGSAFSGEDYDKVYFSFIYGWRISGSELHHNAGQLEKLAVSVSTDGGATWSDKLTPVLKQTLLDFTTLGAAGGTYHPSAVYRIDADITDIIPKDQEVTHIRFEPYGDYGFRQYYFDLHKVEVAGYADAANAPVLDKPATEVDESALRAAIVAHAKEAANLEWTPETTFTAGVTYQAGQPYRGVIRSNANGGDFVSLDRFASLLNANNQYPGTAAYGMDGAAFLFDVLSRVSRAHANGVSAAVSTNRLIPLGGLNTLGRNGLSDYLTANIIPGQFTDAQVYAAYAETQPGDVLISTNPSQAFIVTGETHMEYFGGTNEIDPDNSYVLITTNGTVMRYYWEDEDGVLQNSTSVPSGVEYYGSLFVVDKKVTFRQLKYGATLDASGFGTVSQNFIPFTLYEYTAGAVDNLIIEVVTETTAMNIVSGFSAAIGSNYRLISTTATLSNVHQGGVVYKGTQYANWRSWAQRYSDAGLNAALAALPVGEYNLTLDVASGPILSPGSNVPVTTVLNMNFSVSTDYLTLTADSDVVQQGENVAIQMKIPSKPFTAVATDLKYNAALFTFDAQATASANTALANATFTETAPGTVEFRYFGDALMPGAVVADFIFTANRAGSGAVAGEFRMTNSAASLTDGPDAGDLSPLQEGPAISVTVGYNIIVLENYLPDYSLVLLHTNTAGKFAYGSSPMYDVTEAGYGVDGVRYSHVYGYIVSGAADSSLVGAGSQTPAILSYNYDVNQTGWVDLNDVQAVYNVYSGRMPLSGNMAKWLMADVNSDGQVDQNDFVALWEKIL